MPALLAAGGAASLVAKRNAELPAPSHEDVRNLGISMRTGAALVALWAAVLVAVVVARSLTADPWLAFRLFEIFYRSGSLIFGGGQVLLPLLLDEMVDTSCGAAAGGPAANCTDAGLMTADQFYAGLAAAQSMPGPLFNLSAYLGAVASRNAGQVFLVGTLASWVGLFAPGILLIFGVLPFWARFRTVTVYRKFLPGVNAAAVGLIVTAVFRMGLHAVDASPFPKTSVSLGIASFTAAAHLKAPAPLVVVATGGLGLLAKAMGLP